MVHVVIITSDLYNNMLNLAVKSSLADCQLFLENNGFDLIGELNDTWLYSNESRLEHAEIHKRNIT